MSVRQACCLFSISTSVYYYNPKRKDEDSLISEELLTLIRVNNSWGFWISYHRLKNLGYKWNHKRVYRIYKELKLNLRMKTKKRLTGRVKEPLVRPIYPNVTWSMDFMSDSLQNGRKVRTLNIIDDYNREILEIDVAHSQPAKRVIASLKKLIEWRGKPLEIRVDNGPEFIATLLKEWCRNQGIELKYIQPGKPTQNSLIERFNRTFREDVLDKFMFEKVNELSNYAYAWMWMYNNERPHSSLNYLTPTNFLRKYGKAQQKEKNEFPTLQQDDNNKWEHIILNVAN